MPLMKSGSKKAFSKNVEKEMDAGKPMKQSLAIAYGMKRRAKKMAKGGVAEMNATTVRPDKGYGKIIMINDHDEDMMAEGGRIPADHKDMDMDQEVMKKEEVSKRIMDTLKAPREFVKKNTDNGPKQYAKGGMLRSEHGVILKSSNARDVREKQIKKQAPHLQPTEIDKMLEGEGHAPKKYAKGGMIDHESATEAQRGPKTVTLKHPKMAKSDAFSTRLRDEEDHLESTMPPASPKEQPPKADDEMDAKKSGDPVKKSPIHSKNLNMYAKGGTINHAVSMDEAEDDIADHPHGLEEDDDMMTMPVDEYMAGHFAKGGQVSPEDEIEEEYHSSIADAIMARKSSIDSLHSDSDEDSMIKMADGGEIMGKSSGLFTFPREKKEPSIKSRNSIHSDDSDMADLSRNADEDANEEDQLSFNALRRENYSESEGLKQLDQPKDSNRHGHDIDEDAHDMVSIIRKKMNSKRQI